MKYLFVCVMFTHHLRMLIVLVMLLQLLGNTSLEQVKQMAYAYFYETFTQNFFSQGDFCVNGSIKYIQAICFAAPARKRQQILVLV